MATTKDLGIKPPSIHNWRTTDADEIARRRYRARTESLRVRNLDLRFPVFSNFAVRSASGLTYSVEIRSVSQRCFSCNCVDFRTNGLGTCKHVEAVLLYLEARHHKLFLQAQKNGAGRLDVVPDLVCGALRIENLNGRIPAQLAPIVDGDGFLRIEEPEEALTLLSGGGLLEKEREALLQAILCLGKALGVENRAGEPASLEDALRNPHAHFWGDSLPVICAFASDTSAPAAPAAATLRAIAGP